MDMIKVNYIHSKYSIIKSRKNVSKFDEIYTNRHEYAKEWKKTWAKGVGYFSRTFLKRSFTREMKSMRRMWWWRGPMLFEGYWKALEQTEKAFRGEYFGAGDMDYRDEDGY